MIKWIKNIFRRKTILDDLSIVLVDKIGCGWYNLHSNNGVIYEFHYDEDGSIHIYHDGDIVFSSDDHSEAFSLYVTIYTLPGIHK